MKKEQIKKILSKNISKAIIGTVLWALIITILSLYATSVTVPGSWGVFLSYLKKPFIVGINMMPVLALTLIFAFITNKLWVSYLLSGLITLIMTAVNYLKIMIRNDPFVATDFTLINEAMNIGQRYTFVLHPFFYIAAVIIIAGAIASKILLKYRIRKKFARPVGLIAVIIIFMSLFSHTYLSGIVYSKFKNVGPNPLMNALDDMEMTISKSGIDKNMTALTTPGKKDIEVRWVQDRIKSDASVEAEGCKAFLKVAPVTLHPGASLEIGSASENDLTFKVFRYRLVVNGEEVLLIDRLAHVLKVNGKDYSKKYDKML